MTLNNTLTYEEKQKLKFKNIQKKWSIMSQEEKCNVLGLILHNPCSWIPKQLLYDALDWVITELQYERLEIVSLCEIKRNQFKIVDLDR